MDQEECKMVGLVTIREDGTLIEIDEVSDDKRYLLE
jgi:hypothetical protein